MPHNVISTCPVCSGELSVTRLQCRSCGTAIEGEFQVGRFGRLGRDQLGLLESFLRARGNLKELERELKVSYPTVRARVDGLVRALGLTDGDRGDAEFTDELGDDGEMSFDEAFETEDVGRPIAANAGDATVAANAAGNAPVGNAPVGNAASAGASAGDTAASSPAAVAAAADARREILERLAKHEIGADEAATLIRALGRE